jgi:hypothetical protein
VPESAKSVGPSYWYGTQPSCHRIVVPEKGRKRSHRRDAVAICAPASIGRHWIGGFWGLRRQPITTWGSLRFPSNSAFSTIHTLDEDENGSISGESQVLNIHHRVAHLLLGHSGLHADPNQRYPLIDITMRIMILPVMGEARWSGSLGPSCPFLRSTVSS